jgi:hypothetical protein
MRSGVVDGRRRRMAIKRKPRESAARWTGPGLCRDMIPPPSSSLVEEPIG